MLIFWIIIFIVSLIILVKGADWLIASAEKIRLAAGLSPFIVIVALSFSAKYLIDALIKLSEMLNVAAGVIAITAVSIGTSLPELLVSAKAAPQRKSEIALGNIFGSNVFNALIVIGLPGLFSTLTVNNQTFAVGVCPQWLLRYFFSSFPASHEEFICGKERFISQYTFYLLLNFSVGFRSQNPNIKNRAPR